jgi:pimeloyl-ACP methyl ester carboxylesterase
MATFVLIHGGHHGGWCFARLQAALTERGHASVAPDLPIDDPTAGFAAYTDAVLAAIDPIPADEPLVVVGHSLGAYVAALVAARRPVAHQFFLCAVPAGPGEPIAGRSTAILTPDLLGVEYFADADGCTMQAPSSFFHLFYEDVAPADALDGLRRLRRQGGGPLTEPWPLDEWAAAPRTIVLASDDNVTDLRAATRAAEELTGDPPVVVPGGHSVFLTDPEGLADLLVAGAPT